jgi:hypothetical protein
VPLGRNGERYLGQSRVQKCFGATVPSVLRNNVHRKILWSLKRKEREKEREKGREGERVGESGRE